METPAEWLESAFTDLWNRHGYIDTVHAINGDTWKEFMLVHPAISEGRMRSSGLFISVKNDDDWSPPMIVQYCPYCGHTMESEEHASAHPTWYPQSA